MKRRAFVMASAAIAAIPTMTQAQDGKGPMRRIGMLWESSHSDPRIPDPFNLSERGWIRGRDYLFDFKFGQGRRDRLDALAAELVAAKPDVVVGVLNPDILALMRATSTIPVVMMYASAPVELGIVKSLARPGGNITGTTTSQPEYAGKILQILRDCVPGLRRVTWLWDHSYPGIDVYSKYSRDAARSMQLQVQDRDMRTPEDLQSALAGIERDRPDGVILTMVGVVFERYQVIVEALARSRIPALYTIRQPVADGGLIAYAPDFGAMRLRNREMIDKILRGTKPADIPVEEPAKFLLTINMKTARALGLTIPQKVLLSADELIE